MERDEPPPADSDDKFVAAANFDAQGAVAEATETLHENQPLSKPAHALALQIFVGADLFFAALGLGVSFAGVIAGGLFFRANPLVWLVRPLTITGLCLVLVLALQRSLPKPQMVAPLAAINWWFYVLYRSIATLSDSHASASQRLLLEGFSPLARLCLVIVGDGCLLLLVVLLFAHQPTRAYLGQTSSRPAK